MYMYVQYLYLPPLVDLIEDRGRFSRETQDEAP